MGGTKMAVAMKKKSLISLEGGIIVPQTSGTYELLYHPI
jgi:hypothetical protein